MGQGVTHHCLVCGKGYTHCEKCLVVQNWRSLTDTPEHFQIYMVFEELRNNTITKYEAKEMFESMQITPTSDLTDLLPAVANAIKEILQTSKPTEQTNSTSYSQTGYKKEKRK